MTIYDGDGELSGGKVLVSDGVGNTYWETPTIELESDFRIIMDMIIEKAGMDMKIDEIFNMSDEEKKKLIRNLKISDILDE